MQQQSSKSVCVFCSADDKVPAEYKQISHALGAELAKQGFCLLTAGNNSGLLRAINDGHAEACPNLLRTAVMTELFRELADCHPKIAAENIIWTADVSERIKNFYSLCQTIIILPGGFGTLHELMDCLVASQFGLIKKRIIMLNIDNFWDGVLLQFSTMVAKRTLQQRHLDHLHVVNSVADLMAAVTSDAKLELKQGLADEYWKE